MNEQQYTELCQVCDRVLLAPGGTMDRIAIPWLHVIREHPQFLANYDGLFESEPLAKRFGRKSRRLLRSRLQSARQLARSFRRSQRWFASGKLPERIDVLFVSHLLNASSAGQSRDFYFGPVPDDLIAAGRSVVIALINHSREPAASLSREWSDSIIPRVVFATGTARSEEAELRRGLRVESRRLKLMGNREPPGLLRKVLTRASQEARSAAALTTLRLGSQIGALVARLQPQAIVVTHEGHAWERIAFAAARRSLPGIRCIGYQHATLFRMQHAIRRNLQPEYNPDHILTAGELGKKQLGAAPALGGISLSVLGSNRGVTGGRDAATGASRPDRSHATKRNACLVLPEGIPSECQLLFNFSLECANRCPDIEFILRLHPLVSMHALIADNAALGHLPTNVRLSVGPMEADIPLCRWAIYRGTTAIVQAAGGGLRPIYLESQGEMTIDALHELTGWRMIVRESSEVAQIIARDLRAGLREDSPMKEAADARLAEFFSPFSHRVLLDAIPGTRQ